MKLIFLYKSEDDTGWIEYINYDYPYLHQSIEQLDEWIQHYAPDQD